MSEDQAPWITVMKVWEPMEAEILLGLLKSSGIECVAIGGGAESGLAFTVDGMGEIHIMVPPEQEKEALALLADQDTGAAAEYDNGNSE
jgi:hypothetical protein